MNLNGLQITKGNWHEGLTQSNHLYSLYLAEPQLASSIVTRVYNMMSDYSTPLSFLTGGMGRAKELTSHDFRWPLMGDSEKAIAIVEDAATTNGHSTLGVAGSIFKLKLAERWFRKSDVLAFDDRAYTARVMEEPYMDGTDWVYSLQYITTDVSAYVPADVALAGKEVSKDYSLVERDMSVDAGDTHYATPFMMENTLSTIRKKYQVSGAVQSQVLTISLMDPKSGKLSNTWIKYAEWEYMCQFQREMERMLWYGKYNKKADGTVDLKGSTGNPIFTGAGVREQMAPANKRYYTNLTEKIIRDFMSDLVYNVAPEGSRDFVAFTGYYGFDAFDKAMKDAAGQFTLVDSKFVTGSGNELTLGGQFKTYMGLNGTKITLKHLPLYDNTVINRQLHPVTGRPAESYRFTVLDFGINGGESNVQKVYMKDRELVQWYVPGSCDPFGMKKNAMSASAVDGYEYHSLSESGIMLKNPTACGELILDVDNI